MGGTVKIAPLPLQSPFSWRRKDRFRGHLVQRETIGKQFSDRGAYRQCPSFWSNSVCLGCQAELVDRPAATNALRMQLGFRYPNDVP